MLTENLLKKIGYDDAEIAFILENNKKYFPLISPIVEEYLGQLSPKPYVIYPEGERHLSLKRAEAFVGKVQKNVPQENPFVMNLLAWLNCVPYLYDIYQKFGLRDDVFYESMKDFLYKTRECKLVHGVCGVFVEWFFLLFELKEFGLGRLQYEVYPFEYDRYECDGYHLKKDDMVYSCHIPSSGKLTRELCMESFQMAYEFFKKDLKGDVIPIITHTWLLYKPYIEKVYPEGSNLKTFASLFEILDNNKDESFYDAWRVFHKFYQGTTERLPADNTLRRNFIQYMNDGGDFGEGYGIILYDGKQKKIINDKGRL